QRRGGAGDCGHTYLARAGLPPARSICYARWIGQNSPRADRKKDSDSHNEHRQFPSVREDTTATKAGHLAVQERSIERILSPPKLASNVQILVREDQLAS